MKPESIKQPHDRIVRVAMVGFFNHGYHGFSMDACAAQVGIKKSSLYYYIKSKVNLALQVLAALTERSVKVICEQQSRYSIPEGAYLAILPVRLWESGEPKLRQEILSYYEDWRFNFLGEKSYLSSIGHSNFCERHFLMWLGYWEMQSIGIFTNVQLESEPDE